MYAESFAGIKIEKWPTDEKQTKKLKSVNNYYYAVKTIKFW